MDRIIKITLGLIVIILVAFVGFTSYTGYTENAFRASLTGTYTYTFSLTTDSMLGNLTLFVPVPADPRGNSPVIAKISAHEISGVPASWKTELYDTGKATLMKVTTASLVPPEGTSKKNPYTVTISTNIVTKEYIDTQNPVENSPMFRPVTDVMPTDCRSNATIAAGGTCYFYQTALFARYDADPNAKVTIKSTLTGKNQWTIFESQENEYRTDISLLMFGEQTGWTSFAGYLEKGIGAYTMPGLPSTP
jgi:hypothetical protein